MAIELLMSPFQVADIRLGSDPPETGKLSARCLSRSLVSTKPELMQFPDGAKVRIEKWPQILIEFAKWLAEIRSETEFQRISNSENETLSKRFKPENRGFKRGKGYRLSNGWWLDGGIAAQQQDMWLTMRYLADHFEIDSSNLRIWYRQP